MEEVKGEEEMKEERCPNCKDRMVLDDWVQCDECDFQSCYRCMPYDVWGPLCLECYPLHARDQDKKRIYDDTVHEVLPPNDSFQRF
jgi:hypothetical protein